MYLQSNPSRGHGVNRGDSVSLTATLPLRGLKYMTAPSLPSPSQKVLSTLHSTNGNYTSTLNSTAGLSATLGTQLQPLDSFSSANNDTLSGTLAGIGPSARRLLALDAAAHEAAADESTQCTNGSVRAKKNLRLSEKRPQRASAATDVTTSKFASTAPLAGVSAAASRPAETLRLTATLDGNVRGLRTSRKIHPRSAATAPGFSPNSVLASTVTRNPRVEPPLAGTLRRYLEQELQATADASGSAAVLEQLGPYREAFGAMISAFPGYSALLCDIKSAYENVVQLQCELLTEFYAQEQRRTLSAADHRTDLTNLRVQVKALEEQLSSAHAEMTARESQREAEQHEHERTGLTGVHADNAELRRRLERSEAQLGKLKEASKDDLEKILILVGAVRECDRRMRELEGSVDTMSGQVEELEEFKRLASEAQGELQRFKEKFDAYVPADDFEAMKQYLVEQLADSQATVKRLRRTAAVRGTQLDVINRRVAMLETDLQDEAPQQAGAETATVKSLNGHPLSPRPNWRGLDEALPELADFVKPTHCNALPSKDSGPPAVQLSEEGSAAAEEDESGETELLVVDGARSSAMRAEYLVGRVIELRDRVTSLEKENEMMTQSARQQTADDVVSGAADRLPFAGSTLPTSSPTTVVGANLSATTNVTAATSTTRTRRRSAAGSRSENDAPSQNRSVGPYGGQRAKTLPVPLIGPGLGAAIPPHLRCSGAVRRTVVDPSSCAVLLFGFFCTALKGMLAEVAEGFAVETTAISRRFHDFTADALTRGALPDSVGALLHPRAVQKVTAEGALPSSSEAIVLALPYPCAGHLALNLEEDARDPLLANGASLLLSYVLRGSMPARLAVESADVVVSLISDLNGLVTEAQKSRLQRLSISECMQPILELRTSSEMADLRTSLGKGATFDLVALASFKNAFIRTLFFQECEANMAFYTKLVGALTEKAKRPSELFPSNRNLDTDDLFISLDDIAAAITAVEPCTPAVVVRELSENAVTLSNEDAKNNDDGRNAFGESTGSEEAAPSHAVRLSDIIRALGDAPVIRRSRLLTPPECTL